MKKISQIQMRFYILLLLLINFADAKTFQDQVNSILDIVSNDYTKPLGGLIILGIGIYMIKEKERLKEIFVNCIVIIIATIVITNARTIGDWLF